jgi:hypothetical protein
MTIHKTEKALVDSGATKNFIDPKVIEQLQFPIQKLEQPRIIYNINDTSNKAGSITHKCPIKLQFKDKIKTVDFFVTDLGQDHIVLGFPFLKKFNPKINWETGVILPTNKIFAIPKYLWEHWWKVWKLDGRLLQKADLLRKTSFAQKWVAAADKQKKQLKEAGVPAKYRHYCKVFSEEEAKRLPPHWCEDMTITLKEGALEQLNCKMYPLLGKELQVLRKALNDNVEKGYIKHGTSSFVSPIFFIPKKDGEELCMVINYWKLNDLTKKDYYPLPNLHTELEKLSKHKLFSKFDVQASYNNIWIAKQDQYKVAFKTPLGTCIPTVMTFGFCNAPSIFQWAMNWDLEPLKQKYPHNFANYMNNVAIGTEDSLDGHRLHEQIINEFLTILEKHSYFLKVSKCEFEKPDMEFLGFKVGQGTVWIDPSKIGGISDWPQELKSVKEACQILGVLGYQRAFIQDYTQLAKLLHDLLKKGVKFTWTSKC